MRIQTLTTSCTPTSARGCGYPT